MTTQNKMMNKPMLVTKPWKISEPFTYGCSECGQEFRPPEDRNPQEAMAEVNAAFEEHIREMHGCGDEMR